MVGRITIELRMKMIFLRCLIIFVSLFSSSSIFGQFKGDKPWGQARYYYFKSPTGGKIYCKIDKNSNTVTIGAYYDGCRIGDSGRTGTWGDKRRQDVRGDVILPERIEVRRCDELEDKDYSVGVFTLIGLDSQAFKNCDDLVSITLPNSVEYIKNCAFMDCKNLTTINFSSVTNDVDFMFFSGCKRLQAINVHNSTGTGFHSFDGILCRNGVTFHCPDNYLGTVCIPANIKGIGKESFRNCEQLSEVIVGSGVQYIEEKAFENCTLLCTLVIPENVKKISNNAFQGCTLLSNVSLGDGISEIGTGAFSNCISLKEIILPKGLRHLSNEAFKSCLALEHLIIPEGIGYIDTETFAFCTSLREVKLPNTIEEIYQKAFMGCSALEKVILGPNVKTIYRYAFFSCTNLTSINVPKQAKVYEETFMECYNLHH